MIRLFVALKIPDEIKDRITEQCKSIIPDYDLYRWESEEKIHLTLKFIGEVNEELLPELINEISFIGGMKSFHCKINELGFFYKDNEPKILWTNLMTEDRIFLLVDELNSRLEKLDIKSEKRKFKAHLTLMRIKKYPGKAFIDAINNSKIEETNFVCDKIVLVKSTLSKQGSIYKELKVFELN